MRSSALLLSAATAALAMTLAGPARADIPPPPDSADANCTLEKQCKSGVFCPYAFNPGNEAASETVGLDCRVGAESKGLQRRCRDGGNYRGQELYCPPGETGTWKAPASNPTPAPEPAKIDPPKPEPARTDPPKPEPAKPEPAKPEPARTDPPKPEPAKTGMCSLGGGTDGAMLALLGLLFVGRRRRR